jgi:hypothetical protein
MVALTRESGECCHVHSAREATQRGTRMTLENHALSATVATVAGLLLVVLAMVCGPHASPATVRPYSYTTSTVHNGRVLTCTMDVDANGNGSLNDCRVAS